MSDEYDYLFKSIVVGDGGVGKTALTLRFSKGFFTEDYKMTIGVDFHVKTIAIDTDDGTLRCKLQIWDTGGQERFSSIRPMYYRGSLGALLIFDLTSRESFEHLPIWLEEVRANIKNDIPFLLVGNKSDLPHNISREEINDFTGKFNLYYMETSAKTGEGVGDCFAVLAHLMIGAAVPDTFVSKGVVFNPGQITTAVAASPITEPEFELEIPPVPEPAPTSVPAPEPSFEPEPEFEFGAPPVPEPAPISIPEPIPEPTIEFEPELELEAPPVPEPAPEPTIEPVIEKKTEAALDFEFKLPDEILSKSEKEEPAISAAPKMPETIETPAYVPKAIPFSSNVPVPAPTPLDFQAAKSEISATPEPPAPTFSNSLFPTNPAPASTAIPFSSTLDSTPETKSDSLMDYMPETILSKKEQKKLEKQKMKEEKERKIQEAKDAKEKAIQDAKDAKERAIQEKKDAKERKIQEAKDAKEAKEKAIQDAKDEKERAIQEKKDAKKKKKKKKGKDGGEEEDLDLSATIAAPTSFFESLDNKPEETKPTAAFIPFTASETETSETSKLRIIPNVADIGEISSLPPQPVAKSGLVVCGECGQELSSDYAFCNKCGAKL